MVREMHPPWGLLQKEGYLLRLYELICDGHRACPRGVCKNGFCRTGEALPWAGGSGPCAGGLGGSGICRFLFHIHRNKLALVLRAVRWGTRCFLECRGCPRRTSPSAEIG